MNNKLPYILDYADKEDTLFLRFDREANYARSKHEKKTNIVLDMSEKNKLIGIEILNATTMFKMTKEEIMEMCKDD